MSSISREGDVALPSPQTSLICRLEWVAIISIALLLLVLPQAKVASLHTSFYDLGQYATILNRIANHDEWGWALRGHAHLLAFPYVWIYAASPTPFGLLAAQSATLVATAWLAGRVWQAFGAGRATTGALIYLLSLPVWFNALFDFHFEHQFMPLLLGALLLAHRPGRAALTGAVTLSLALCLVKEVYALTAVCMGLYLVLARRRYVAGMFVMVASAVYFKLITGVVIPYFSDGRDSGGLWENAFGHLGQSIPEIAVTLALHPWLPLLELVSQPRKLLYFGALAVSLGLIFVRRPLLLLPALPVLLITLLSRNPNHTYLGHHYSVGIVMAGFVAAAAAIGELDARKRKVWTGAVLTGSVVVLVLFGPAPISRLFVMDKAWNYGLSAYLPTERDRAVAERVERALTEPGEPPLDQRAIATQNTLFVPATGNAALLVAFPEGVFAPTPILVPHQRGLIDLVAEALSALPGQFFPSRRIYVDTVILDLKRPWYIRDLDCQWLAGACTDAAREAEFTALKARLAGEYRVIVDSDGVLLYRRR